MYIQPISVIQNVMVFTYYSILDYRIVHSPVKVRIFYRKGKTNLTKLSNFFQNNK